MTQFSLFGAAVEPPGLDDLGGVLLAGGHWVNRAEGSRLSVVVVDRWRADALAAEFAARGAGGDADAVIPAEGGFAARTAISLALTPLAARWTRGANEGPPRDFVLTAGGLRLWTIAAGRGGDAAAGAGLLLGTAEPDEPTHRAAGAQLARLGLAGVAVSYRGGPGWRITSAKRIRRLVELVGPAPDGAGHDWPTVR